MDNVTTPPGKNDILYRAMERPSGTIEWVKIGEVGETDVVTVLPPASVENEGYFLTLSGGVGVRDEIYLSIKNESDVYEWVRIGEVGETDVVGALPPATVNNEGRMLTLTAAPGARSRAYICLKSDSNTYSWIEFANGGP